MNNKRIKLAHVNIRSLYPKLKDLEHYIDYNKIDILAISETWLDGAVDSSAVHLQNFNFYRRDRVGRGGGVGFI